MREDMDKIIVERPRRKHGRPRREKYGRGKQRHFDDMPRQIGLRKSHKDTSWPNENLAPLRRYLEKQVGRPWNNVYSEITERININSTVQRHILQHVFDYVEANTFIGSDGKVWTKGGGGGFWRKRLEPIEKLNKRDVLYVDPNDGLLKKLKRPKGWKRPWSGITYVSEFEANRREGPKGTQFHKIEGVWYVVRIAPIPPVNELRQDVVVAGEDGKDQKWTFPSEVGAKVDVLIRESLFYLHNYNFDKYTGPRALWDRYGKKGIYGASIKQMNKKELKAAKLKNDTEQE